MVKHQRWDFVDQLDRLIIVLSVHSYFLDPSILVLILRVAAQQNLSRPQESHPTRNLRALTFLVLSVTAFVMGRTSIYGPGGSGAGPRGVFLDFVGTADTPASKTQVFLSSGFICLCQLVCVLVSYETGHNPPIETNVQHLDDHLAPTTTEPAASDLSPSSDSSRPQPAIPRTDDSTREPRTDFLAPRKRTSLRRRRPTTEVEEANGLLACEEEGVSLGAARSGRELHEEDEVEEEKDGSELPVLELRLWSSVRRLLSSSPAARDDDASTSSLSSEATTATVAVG